MASKIEQAIFKMLTTSTGAALCDSGGAYGRHWEKNQKKALADFQNEPEVSLSEHYKQKGTYEAETPNISVFHYLTQRLELDEICDAFNKRVVQDWDGEFYGTSETGAKWIKERFKPEGEPVNTYNHASSLSQVLQYQILRLRDSGERSHRFDTYILLQIHQGCDVRGGYTDARLFKVRDDLEFFGSEDVYGRYTLSDGNVYNVSNSYNGETMTFDDMGATEDDAQGQTYLTDTRELPRLRGGRPTENEQVYKYLERTGLSVVDYDLQLVD